MSKPAEEMNKPELLQAISALGWCNVRVDHNRVKGTHAKHPGGWEEWSDPTPGRKALLLRFLTNVQNPELLNRYALAQ